MRCSLAPLLLKAQPERLYGRQRGHPLRARQQLLLKEVLPRVSLSVSQASDPYRAFMGPEVRDLWLEIGFGGGEHALSQAARHPEVGYIASEVFENGLCSLLSHLVPEGEEEGFKAPDHFRLWPQDGRLLLKKLPDACLGRAYLMFPDPWPKVRHSTRRFIHPENLHALARVLKPGGLWRVASDHPVYQQWVEHVMASQPFFETLSLNKGERPEGWSPTRYEAKAYREGRLPYYWTFARRRS